MKCPFQKLVHFFHDQPFKKKVNDGDNTILKSSRPLIWNAARNGLKRYQRDSNWYLIWQGRCSVIAALLISYDPTSSMNSKADDDNRIALEREKSEGS